MLRVIRVSDRVYLELLMFDRFLGDGAFFSTATMKWYLEFFNSRYDRPRRAELDARRLGFGIRREGI